jgi:hypothetical protein
MHVSGTFRHVSPGAKAGPWSDLHINPKVLEQRRVDIQLARASGAAHIDEIKLNGPPAEAAKAQRAMDEKQGICRSLSLLNHKERKALDPRAPAGASKIVAEHFALRPARIVRRMPHGTETEEWRDCQRNVIPRPIDAPPQPSPAPPTRGDLFCRRNPHVARVIETDGTGKITVEWYARRTGQVIGTPAGDLGETGPIVALEHQAAVAAMSDAELLAAVTIGTADAPEAAKTALAVSLREIAARSPEHAVALFMSGGRWRYAPGGDRPPAPTIGAADTPEAASVAE